MIKKVKIRDLTEEQQKRYCDKKNGHCDGCPFCLKNFEGKDWTCASSLSHIPFSDEFLDQEVEIEVPDILTKEEKEWLKATIKLLPFKTGKIRHCKFREGEFIIMFTTKAEDNYADLSIKYDLFQKMKINQYYTLEELGL